MDSAAIDQFIHLHNKTTLHFVAGVDGKEVHFSFSKFGPPQKIIIIVKR